VAASGDAPGAPTGLHVVGAGEDRGVPFLMATATSGGRPTAVALEGSFAWRVSGPRTCIGRWRGGEHVPCSTATPVTSDYVCLACGGLSSPECVFEPRCADDPASCTCPFGVVPHVVYIAFYGPLAKVGLTQGWRLATRLREQGADAYFVAAQCPDRGTARRTERSIAFVHGIPEFRSPREVLPQMARAVDWGLIAVRSEALAARLGDTYAPGPLVRIEDHPVQQPLGGVPRRVQPYGRHVGTWLGAKGQNLFYEEPHRLDAARRPIAAIKCSDLLGRTVIGDGAAA